jgi:hypothetical protein
MPSKRLFLRKAHIAPAAIVILGLIGAFFNSEQSLERIGGSAILALLVWKWDWLLLDTNSEKVAKIAQVLVFIVGGYWAYSRFNEAERPALELRANTACSISVEFLKPGTDLITLAVEVGNSGKKSFDIEEVQIRGWTDKEQELKGEKFRQIDPAEAEANWTKIFDQTISTGNLTHRLSPGLKGYQRFIFLMQDPEWLYFRVDFKPIQKMQIPPAFHIVRVRRELAPKAPAPKKNTP